MDDTDIKDNRKHNLNDIIIKYNVKKLQIKKQYLT